MSFGSQDTKKGTFTLALYLWLVRNQTAAGANFTIGSLEPINERAGSRERTFESLDAATGAREAWHRIQDPLHYRPSFKEYPLDTQEIIVLVEASTKPLNRWGCEVSIVPRLVMCALLLGV